MMKSYERLALLIVLCGTMFALNLQNARAQAGNATAGDSLKALAVVFPLRIGDPLQFEKIVAPSAGLQPFTDALRDALDVPQSLPNGNPFPEATSLNTLLSASIRKKTRSVPIVEVNLASAQPSLSTLDGLSIATILSRKEFEGEDSMLFTMYVIVDDGARFCSFIVRKDGQWAKYVSDRVSMFDLPNELDKAVVYFFDKGLIRVNIPGSFAVESPGATPSVSIDDLPIIQPWNNKKDYENAQKSFKFAIGGTAIGISLTFVSAGIWQMYREAAYRNGAFSNASTISAVAAGACAAITATFLTFTITDAVRMLRASR